MLSDHGLAVGAGVHVDLAVVHGEGDQAAAQPASVGEMESVLDEKEDIHF